MDKQGYGSVVAMEYRRPPSVAFNDIVEEFDIAFKMADSQTRALTWKSDDIALIDRDGVRVGLGWLPGREQGQASHLVVAVGPPPGKEAESKIDPRSYRYLADRIAERTREYLPCTAILHGKAHQPVSAGLIGSTFDLLRVNISDTTGGRDSTDFGGWSTSADEREEDTWSHPWERLQNFNPLNHLRLERAEPTEPLRLTVHTLALSLCLYVPALGAAMFTYTMLRDIFPMAAQSV